MGEALQKIKVVGANHREAVKVFAKRISVNRTLAGYQCESHVVVRLAPESLVRINVAHWTVCECLQ